MRYYKFIILFRILKERSKEELIYISTIEKKAKKAEREMNKGEQVREW